MCVCVCVCVCVGGGGGGLLDILQIWYYRVTNLNAIIIASSSVLVSANTYNNS